MHGCDVPGGEEQGIADREFHFRTCSQIPALEPPKATDHANMSKYARSETWSSRANRSCRAASRSRACQRTQHQAQCPRRKVAATVGAAVGTVARATLLPASRALTAEPTGPPWSTSARRSKSRSHSYWPQPARRRPGQAVRIKIAAASTVV